MTDVYFHRAIREVRQQAIRWLREGRGELGTVVAILNDYDRVREATEAAERECERLRGLIDENERVRAILETIDCECERLREEVRQLRTEAERHRRERDAIAEWLSHFTSEVVMQLRPSRPRAGDPEPAVRAQLDMAGGVA
ncbi:MAG: hypothetical protein ACE5JN_02575 [Candidatus Methylomirabilia bacterium]